MVYSIDILRYVCYNVSIRCGVVLHFVAIVMMKQVVSGEFEFQGKPGGREMENRTEYISKLEERTLKVGGWSEEDHGCRMLARAQGLIIAVRDCSKLLEESFSDAEFEELLNFLQATDADDIKALYPDDQIFKYRTVNDHPLKGMMFIGEDRVMVDFQNLPEDHMIPEVIAMQRNYVVYQMIAKCRRKVFMMANRDIFRVKPETSSPLAARRMARLMDVLAESMTEEECTELKNRVGKMIAAQR